MKNLILIIAMSISATAFSQTVLVINDLKYNEGIDTEWSVLYIPHYPEVEGEYLEEDNQWYFNVRGDHRVFTLRANNPGIYQVKQELDDVIIQISSVRVD
tara:strand:- start:3302 stop:3601 length:300 start_codon:yes stop_codon:yes gene_type:complete